MKKVFICAGELSGDIYGAQLMHSLSKVSPGISFHGIGGDRMVLEGLNNLAHIRETAVMGIGEVLKKYSYLKNLIDECAAFLEKEKPDLFIPIDYPGFNLRLAKKAKELGIPVLYYIPPGVWVWGKRRIKKLRAYCERLAVTLPFEEAYYRKHGLTADFVGHPLMVDNDAIMEKEAAELRAEIGEGPFLGIMAGSRKQEVTSMLPELLRAAKKIVDSTYLEKVAVSIAENLDESFVKKYTRDFPDVILVKGRSRGLQKLCSFMIVKSGSATLETALAETPMVLVYRASKLFYIFASLVMKKDQKIGLPNILLKKLVIPELLQDKMKAEFLSATVISILKDEDDLSRMKKDYKEIKQLLGNKIAPEETAKIAMEIING